MLSQAVLPNNTVIGYTYDASNRRIAKKVNGVITERFLYKDQLEPVAKIDGNGDILELYIYGEKGHVPGYIVKGGQTYRVISDYLGSVRMVVNANTSLRIATAWQAGDIAQEISYNEFGIVLTDSNPGFQPFYFAGGIYDLDTKLVKFGARDYDSETGRWISKEPLGFEGSNNFYSYVNGDPVNAVDPTGLVIKYAADNEYNKIVESIMLNLIKKSKTAKNIYNLIQSSKQTIYIKMALEEEDFANSYSIEENTIYFNKNHKVLFDGSKNWHTRAPEIGLAHEMIHALHDIKGTLKQNVIEEEWFTIGLYNYSKYEFTENAIRKNFNTYRRTSIE